MKAQDIGFSQFYANPVFLNPALAGTTECGRLHFNYRNQWLQVPNAYTTYNVSYDQSLPSISSGFGFTLTADNAGKGILRNYLANAIYSYNLLINENLNFMAGFQASYQYFNFDWDKLIFYDQLQYNGNLLTTREIEPDVENSGFFDLSFGGVLGIKEKSFIGFAVHHVTEPKNELFNNDLAKLPMKFTVHGGTSFELGENIINGNKEPFSISPNLIYQQQGTFQQINAGAYFSLEPLIVGAWYRFNFDNPDAAIALIGIKYDQLKFGYSYDYTVSKLTGNGGTHEISIAYSFCIYTMKDKIKKIRAIKSPVF